MILGIGILWLVLQVGGFIAILLISWLFFDKRYNRNKKLLDSRYPDNTVEVGFFPTAEVFIDPKDGLRYRVYYNPRTGERDYIKEL